MRQTYDRCACKSESGLTERLRHLCQPNVLDTADLDTIQALLAKVRGDFEAGALPDGAGPPAGRKRLTRRGS